MSVPTIEEFDRLYPTEDSFINFLIERNIFYKTIDCPNCNKEMKQNINQLAFRCDRESCHGRRISIKIHTFFYKTNLKCKEIFKLAIYWLNEVSIKSAIKLTKFSNKTVCKYYGYFRQLVASSLTEENQKIGGPNITVQIDETKMGKRKYNRGHRVEGIWVVVGIEDKQNGKLFIKEVENRSAQTLNDLIEKYVIPGSNIYTDCWKGYNTLDPKIYNHQTVNHSKYFKEPVSGVCTNRVEGLNSALKRKIPIRNRTKKQITGHLCEYVWRRLNSTNLYDAFVNAIRDIHYDVI